MRFRLRVRCVGGDNEWNEDYEDDEIETVEDAARWARETVDQFNAELRPHEVARELISVKPFRRTKGEGDRLKSHDWEKVNLVTIQRAGEFFDEYECVACEISGRRYGIGGNVIRDHCWSARVYDRCDTAQAHQAKRRARARVER